MKTFWIEKNHAVLLAKGRANANGGLHGSCANSKSSAEWITRTAMRRVQYAEEQSQMCIPASVWCGAWAPGHRKSEPVSPGVVAVKRAAHSNVP
jgi:hypothetical protein